MRLRYLLLALTAAALVPILAGCGSGEEATAQTTMPLKKYIKETDLLCGDRSIEQAELAGAYNNKHPNSKEADWVLPALVPPLEKEIVELHALGVPRGHEEEAELVVEEMEKALSGVKEEPNSAFFEKTNPFEKSNQLAAKLGLGDCSDNP